MANLSDYQFIKCEDGIYLTKLLKSGKLSKDSRKIETSEILALFEDCLYDYCAKNVTNVMTVEHSDSNSYYEAKLFVR